MCIMFWWFSIPDDDLSPSTISCYCIQYIIHVDSSVCVHFVRFSITTESLHDCLSTKYETIILYHLNGNQINMKIKLLCEWLQNKIQTDFIMLTNVRSRIEHIMESRRATFHVIVQVKWIKIMTQTLLSYDAIIKFALDKNHVPHFIMIKTDFIFLFVNFLTNASIQ